MKFLRGFVIFFQENERLTLVVELHKNKKGSKKPSDHTRL